MAPPLMNVHELFSLEIQLHFIGCQIPLGTNIYGYQFFFFFTILNLIFYVCVFMGLSVCVGQKSTPPLHHRVSQWSGTHQTG